MSYSISTLLTRNLHDVFGENDPARRRATIDDIFTEDSVFYESGGVYRGRDEIDRIAGAIKATHPDFRYQPIAGPEECAMSPQGAAPLRWLDRAESQSRLEQDPRTAQRRRRAALTGYTAAAAPSGGPRRGGA